MAASGSKKNPEIIESSYIHYTVNIQARSIENEFGKASDQFQRNFQAWAYPLSKTDAQYLRIKIASEKKDPKYFIRGGYFIYGCHGI